MTVTLSEVVRAVRARAVPIAAESAGYLMLAVADQALAAGDVRVDAEHVELEPDGSLRLGRSSSGAAAERAIRLWLGELISASSSVGPGLRRAAEARTDTGLDACVRELEVALIPVNRAAARRSLSRVHRDTERARAAGRLDALPAPEVLEPSRAVEAPPVVEAAPVVRALPVVEAPRASEPEEDANERSDESLEACAPISELPRVVEERQLAVDVVADDPLTRPEPVVVRSRERARRTPTFGTRVSAALLDVERTEPSPEVSSAPSPAAPPALASSRSESLEATPVPEPSVLPNVVSAMVHAYSGFAEDEAPTRLRPEVVTAWCEPSTEPPNAVPPPTSIDVAAHEVLEPVPSESPPEPPGFASVERTLPLPPVAPRPVVTAGEPERTAPLPPVATAVTGAASQAIRDAEAAESMITESDIVESDIVESDIVESDIVESDVLESDIVESDVLESDVVPRGDIEWVPFESGEHAPEAHEARTWDPGPVTSELPYVPESLVIGEVQILEPVIPATLGALERRSSVADLADSFHVSVAASDRELRGALKELAGLDLTPLPRVSSGER